MEEKFQYTYNAKEVKEIKKILERYEKVANPNFDEIKRLDREAERPVKICFSVMLVSSILLFGFGLSLSLAMNHLVAGAIVGVTGIFFIIYSFHVKEQLREKRRKLYAERILALAKKTKIH